MDISTVLYAFIGVILIWQSRIPNYWLKYTYYIDGISRFKDT